MAWLEGLNQILETPEQINKNEGVLVILNIISHFRHIAMHGNIALKKWAAVMECINPSLKLLIAS